jgi:hypothetical protein
LALATGARAQGEAPPGAAAPSQPEKAPEPAKIADPGKAPEPATLAPGAVPTAPDVPDEPLPEWRPPTHRSRALFLQVGPEVQSAQKLRQVGLWISSLGWAQLLAAGILYGWAVNLNEDASHPHADGSGMVNTSGQITQTQTFDPALEDERNRVQNASLSLIGIGGALALGGFIVYTIGQARITVWHKEHPNDPLPPLSGL